MASSYSTIGRIELMATGEKTNLWGPIANTGLQLLEDMIAGATTVTDLGGTVTLTANNGASDQSRKGIIICNATLTSNLILVIPNVTKTYVVHNRTSGAYTVSMKTSAGAATVIPQGSSAVVACDAVTTANGAVYFVSGPLSPSSGLSFLVDGSVARGDVLYRGASDWSRLPAGTDGYFLRTQGAGADPVWASSDSVPTMRNALINGAMMVAQRSAGTFPNDDAYTSLDRWLALSDGNGICAYAQETTTYVPTNGYASLAIVVGTTNKKFGVAQIIEQKNCIGLIGETVTLSFKARVVNLANMDNVKAAIVSWDGTADTVTSDIVSAWNVEGTNPTLVANWTYENTPVNLSVTDSFATYSVSAAIDTVSTKNISVFIWSDVTTTTNGDALVITDVQLEANSVRTNFERRHHSTELALCQRYYLADAPVAAGGNATAGGQTARAPSGIRFPIPMRVAPTIAFGSVSYGNCASLAAGSVSTMGTNLGVTSSASGPVYWASTMSADAEL